MSNYLISKWKNIEFKDIVEDSAFGPRFSGEKYSDLGNVATLRTTDMSEDGRISYETMPLAELEESRFSNHFLRSGDLVISWSGRIGTTGIFEEFSIPVIPGAFLIRFRLKKSVSPLFYRYFFNSSQGRNLILSVARGAAQQNITSGNVLNLKIPLPPIEVQDKISHILSAYDDLIENNRRRIQLLEESARLLYKEWFVHLRFPGHEHVAIHDGVPEGWEKKKLCDLADITMGQSPKSEYYNEDSIGLPFHQGVSNFGDRFPEHKVFCTLESRIAEPGDILFSVRAPVGRINLTQDKIVIGRGLAAIRSTIGHQNFFLYQLKNYFFKEDMMGGGAIFAAITKKDLHNVELLTPSNSITKLFTEHVSPIDQQIAVLHIATSQLKQARDLLLPRLMNGEIPV